MGAQFWLRTSWLCHLIGSVCSISCVCSLWSIAAISVNRYILLCRKHLYDRIFTIQNTIIMCLTLWVATMLLDLPNFLDWGDHTYDMKTMACSYDRTKSHSYTVFFISMFVAIPLVTVLACSLNIYIVVRQSKMRVATHKNRTIWAIPEGSTTGTAYVYLDKEITERGTVHPGHLMAVKKTPHLPLQTFDPEPVPNDSLSSPLESLQQSQIDPRPKNQKTVTFARDIKTKTWGIRLARGRRGKNLKSDIRLARTLFIIFIVFVICWLPYASFCVIDKYDSLPKEAYTVAILFAHSSSTLNSVLYAATNKGFRDGYKVFLKKCRCHIN